MADELNFGIAIQLAKTLKSIEGFSFDEAVINATAGDLMRWCKGAIIGGQVWSAENQAHWLVTEAREKWQTWNGTAGLHKLFRSKFCMVTAPERQTFDMGEKPPVSCKICNDWGMAANAYCDCEAGQELKKTWGAKGLAEIFRSKGITAHKGPKTRPETLFVSAEDVKRAEEEYRLKKAKIQ